MQQTTEITSKSAGQSPSPYLLARKDIINGIKAWRMWMFLAWKDIQLRYRRSYLGPFWITINMAVTIYTIGFLYGRLFKMDLNEYYPTLAAGILTWNLISSSISDFINVFSNAQDYIKQIKLPYFIYILRVTARNLIIFLHTIIVFIPIILLLNIKVTLATFFLVPSLLIILLLGCVYGLFLGLLGARFRDLSPIITSLLQVTFFLTPVLWPVTILPEHYRYLLKFNPFAQLIELIRFPMLGKLPSFFAIGESLALLAVGVFIVFYLFAKKRKQIVYWL